MKKIRIGTSFAVGSVCVISLGTHLPASAAETPFSMNVLPHGYMVADASDTKAPENSANETRGEGAGVGDYAGATTQAEKKIEAKPMSQTEGKVSDGWCGDGGRCGYKRRWP